MTSIAPAVLPVTQVEADALVVLLAPGKAKPSILGSLPTDVARDLSRALRALRTHGKADELTWLPGVDGVTAPVVLVAGVGGEPGQPATAEAYRRAAGSAMRALVGRGTAAFLLPDLEAATVAAIAEGIGFGGYTFTAHRGAAAQAKAAESAPLGTVLLGTGRAARGRDKGWSPDARAQDALRRADVLGRAVSWARDLVNAPPNVLFPRSFADRVVEAAPPTVTVEVIDPAGLAELGCGGLLAVGGGSARGPHLVHLTYAPARATSRLAYVGKGITFDSGGLSLKSQNAMTTMKCDMAGAAAVVAAVFAIAELGVPVAVEGWLALAENMPSGRAMRPNDVITMADGTTCEIVNTDAEGRLVLADALVLATREKPDAIVDIATLTGAAVVALGHRTAAVLANDEDLHGEVTSAATDCGESVWPMPIPEELRRTLDSTVADRRHWAEREGGALGAAAFLREFVGAGAEGAPTPWAHLDIAGPAFHEGAPYGYTPKGGTGFGVRTLVHLAESRA